LKKNKGKNDQRINQVFYIGEEKRNKQEKTSAKGVRA